MHMDNLLGPQKGSATPIFLSQESGNNPSIKSSTPPAGISFDPKQHAVRSERGEFVINQYLMDTENPSSLNPFNVLANSWGGRQVLPRQIWNKSYSSPYKDRDIAFVNLLNGGLCTGFAAMVAQAWTETRFHQRPPLSRHVLRSVYERLVTAHCHVLTDNLMHYYKYFLFNPAKCHEILQFWLKPESENVVITFVPKLDINFLARLSHSHAVMPVGWKNGPDGTLYIQVWDPNIPHMIKGPLVVDKYGNFEYHSNFGRECIISNQSGSPIFVNVNNTIIPTHLKEMVIVVIPASAYFSGRLPFFDAWNVLFN